MPTYRHSGAVKEDCYFYSLANPAASSGECARCSVRDQTWEIGAVPGIPPNRRVAVPNNLHRELLFNHKRIRNIAYPDCSGRFLAGNENPSPITGNVNPSLITQSTLKIVQLGPGHQLQSAKQPHFTVGNGKTNLSDSIDDLCSHSPAPKPADERDAVHGLPRLV